MVTGYVVMYMCIAHISETRTVQQRALWSQLLTSPHHHGCCFLFVFHKLFLKLCRQESGECCVCVENSTWLHCPLEIPLNPPRCRHSPLKMKNTDRKHSWKISTYMWASLKSYYWCQCTFKIQLMPSTVNFRQFLKLFSTFIYLFLYLLLLN